jgi:uncharacterized paraquat-inducible protein A
MRQTKTAYEIFLEKLILNYETVNLFSPFPFYDTELIEELKNTLKRVMADRKNYYDSLPVACCKHCKELRLQIDEMENDVCLRCGAQGNDIAEIHENIFEYSVATGKTLE